MWCILWLLLRPASVGDPRGCWNTSAGDVLRPVSALCVCPQTPMQNRPTIDLPGAVPPVALRIFRECTQLQPADRPTTLDIVQWLRAE